ncbi:GAF and ANTAR domain-containing protein [Leifsonia sp. NPDC058230]|uniref:GAF and ANTAR domain-containing protein n=1 Tax=Leifsonia sp. NPDC058230 TaxID=3346391 RepID=UPI0036DB8B92
MTTSDRFTAAMESVSLTRVPASDLSRPFVELFPVTGTAVSTIGDLLGSETVSASDARAARLDELQFDLGVGPCWDALHSAEPVLEPDLRNRPRRVWPVFSETVARDGIRSLFAFPMLVGPLKIGAIDMYAEAPTELDAEATGQATALAGVVARQILQQALAEAGSEYTEDVSNPFSRRIIHQATGMVLAQLGVDASDARLVIQGHAFAAGRSMMEVAQDILERRLDFSNRQGEIEDSE